MDKYTAHTILQTSVMITRPRNAMNLFTGRGYEEHETLIVGALRSELVVVPRRRGKNARVTYVEIGQMVKCNLQRLQWAGSEFLRLPPKWQRTWIAAVAEYISIPTLDRVTFRDELVEGDLDWLVFVLENTFWKPIQAEIAARIPQLSP
jgi:hypothetical protein